MKTPRRGRPRAFDPDQVIGELLEVFWSKGFAATSLDDLTEASGVVRPSLFLAFGNKEEMYLKAIDHYASKRACELQALVDGCATIREALARHLFAMLALYFSGPPPRGCAVLCTMPSAAASSPTIRAALARHIASTDEALERAFRLGVGRGETFCSRSPAILARLTSSALLGLAIRARAGQDRFSLELSAHDTISHLCY